MATVSDHYENLLAGHYSWMSGGAEQKIEENRNFFSSNGIAPRLSKIAIDLGAGPGFQSIPLAEAGFDVIAVDLSRELLVELDSRKGGLKIKTVYDDMLNFSTQVKEPVELIVCMGDTLTHLETVDHADRLFTEVYKSLESGGKFILIFRDLATELKELDRFIRVRSDENRIFTCFLEYEKDYVIIHDLVYIRDNHKWILLKSFYRKVKIAMDWVTSQLEKAGFRIETADNTRGLITVIAEK